MIAMSEQEPEKDGLRILTSHDDVGVGAAEQLKRKRLRRDDNRKLASEGISRDGIDRRSGRPTWEEMVFDHENDRYQKRVIFKDTGELVFPPKDERLSEHQGYGHAKPKA